MYRHISVGLQHVPFCPGNTGAHSRTTPWTNLLSCTRSNPNLTQRFIHKQCKFLKKFFKTSSIFPLKIIRSHVKTVLFLVSSFYTFTGILQFRQAPLLIPHSADVSVHILWAATALGDIGLTNCGTSQILCYMLIQHLKRSMWGIFWKVVKFSKGLFCICFLTLQSDQVVCLSESQSYIVNISAYYIHSKYSSENYVGGNKPLVWRKGGRETEEQLVSYLLNTLSQRRYLREEKNPSFAQTRKGVQKVVTTIKATN